MYDKYGGWDDHSDYGNEPPGSPTAGSSASPVRRADNQQEFGDRRAEAAGADSVFR